MLVRVFSFFLPYKQACHASIGKKSSDIKQRVFSFLPLFLAFLVNQKDSDALGIRCSVRINGLRKFMFPFVIFIFLILFPLHYFVTHSNISIQLIICFIHMDELNGAIIIQLYFSSFSSIVHLLTTLGTQMSSQFDATLKRKQTRSCS